MLFLSSTDRFAGHFVTITTLARRRCEKTFTEKSCRQKPVVINGSAVIAKHYVHSRFYIPVLESVVKNNCVHGGFYFLLQQIFYSLNAVGICHKTYFGEACLYLKRFIAYFVGRRLGRGYNHPLCLSSVSSTNDCRFRFVAYDSENVFHVRGLARASDGQISHANNRNGEFLRFYYAPVKQKIAHTCCRTVNPRHGMSKLRMFFPGMFIASLIL